MQFNSKLHVIHYLDQFVSIGTLRKSKDGKYYISSAFVLLESGEYSQSSYLPALYPDGWGIEKTLYRYDTGISSERVESL